MNAIARRRRHSLVLALALGAAGSGAQAQGDGELDLSLGISGYRWEEFDSADDRLLREEGPLFSLGISYGNLLRADRGLLYDGFGTLYGGSVAYDGQTQAGDPFDTDTRYFGGRIEGGVGYRIQSVTGASTHLDVTAGLGVDAWLRSIQSGTLADGTPVSGLDEQYSIMYGRLGIGPAFTATGWRGTLQLGLKYPLWTDQTAYTSDIGCSGDVHLRPKGTSSPYLRFSNRFALGGRSVDDGGTALRFDVYYDTFRFDASDPAATSCYDAGTGQYEPAAFYQPKSTMDVIGIELGIGF